MKERLTPLAFMDAGYLLNRSVLCQSQKNARTTSTCFSTNLKQHDWHCFCSSIDEIVGGGIKMSNEKLGPTLKHLAISGTFLFSWQPFLYIPAFELEKMGIFLQQHFARK